jgi:2-polyprenyl-3-methyl-5-hydroxy-6-metoxy-1,4-benzoquinol methylase
MQNCDTAEQLAATIGVRFLGTAKPYWGEVPQETMQKVLEMAPEMGWEFAARQLMVSHDPSMENYIFDPRRRTGIALMGLGPGQTVLDVGCGLGCLSEGLARAGATLYSLDSVLERVVFTGLRCSQQCLTNVNYLCGAFIDVDLPDGSLDAIVMNGVLEWLALSDPDPNPKRVQVTALERAYRLLKPGGTLYIGIENRVSFSTLRGHRDHSGLPYTSLMPRWMADIRCRMRPKGEFRSSANRGGYRTYTYTLNGYRKLLGSTGFGSVKAYWPMPGYNEPYLIVPLDSAETLTHWERNDNTGKLWRTIRRMAPWVPPTKLAAVAATDFLLLARKE